ncbi:MAG: DUF541 domain-containing protein [Chloroflexi bacterium]|nr:DUF541 domain-containing protein [Chloroflexota bacterium]MBM4451257.1 DUF541 domain-containing protein [Chloroflexota bacterium]
MKKMFLWFSGLVLVAVLMLAAGCVCWSSSKETLPSGWSATAEIGVPSGFICSQQDVGISVSGEGRVKAAPDVAILSLGIEAQETTVAAAQREAAIAMDKVMKALRADGVADKDIQTTQFSIYPVRRWVEKEEREIIVGYRVTNMVTAKIRQIDKAGDIIDDVAEAGGDLTRIQDIGFTIDDPLPYYRQAREKAVQDAAAKAKQLADLSGVKLGRPLYISEGGGYVPPIVRKNVYTMMEAGTAPAPTPISPGELEFQLNVSIVYDIR